VVAEQTRRHVSWMVANKSMDRSYAHQERERERESDRERQRERKRETERERVETVFAGFMKRHGLQSPIQNILDKTRKAKLDRYVETCLLRSGTFLGWLQFHGYDALLLYYSQAWR